MDSLTYRQLRDASGPSSIAGHASHAGRGASRINWGAHRGGSMLGPNLTRPYSGALVGYARSSINQPLDRQLCVLVDAGCTAVFLDDVAGRTADRPELASCLASLRPGDTLVVPSLERLSHSVYELVGLVARLSSRAVGFRSVREELDTKAPAGHSGSEVFIVLAQFMHEAEAEGAREGRAAARASGQRLGRPPSLTPDLVLRARELLTDANATVASVARQLGVGRSSLYRHLPELTGRAQPNGRAEDFDAQLAPAGSERQPDGDRSTLGPGAATGTPEGHRSRR